MLMLDVFLIFNITLIVLLAILIYRNKSWKTQPIVIVLFVVILILFVLSVILD